MTSHCANPNCATPLGRLLEGRIFQFEVKPKFPTENSSPDKRGPSLAEWIRLFSHFWLCGQCSSKLTLAFDALRGVIVTPSRAT
jgi:hypothetical protein